MSSERTLVTGASQKHLFLTFDMEEFFGNVFGLGMPAEHMYELSMPGAERLVALMEKIEGRATFFFTLRFAEYCPQIVTKLASLGHEIACHGYDHDHDYSEMPFDECRDYLTRSKEGLEDLCGMEVTGYRAPQFYHPDRNLLRELGFVYDSSLHPWLLDVSKQSKRFLIGGRKALTAQENGVPLPISPRKTRPFIQDGIVVIPVSVTPLLHLPFSWVWFRNMGYLYAQVCARMTLWTNEYVHLYFHPYDFSDLDIAPYNQQLSRTIVRRTGIPCLSMLEDFSNWCTQEMGLQCIALCDRVEHWRGESDRGVTH